MVHDETAYDGPKHPERCSTCAALLIRAQSVAKYFAGDLFIIYRAFCYLNFINNHTVTGGIVQRGGSLTRRREQRRRRPGNIQVSHNG
jgi:hypothetical protein